MKFLGENDDGTGLAPLCPHIESVITTSRCQQLRKRALEMKTSLARPTTTHFRHAYAAHRRIGSSMRRRVERRQRESAARNFFNCA